LIRNISSMEAKFAVNLSTGLDEKR
jgi:hypothetical protein